MPDLDHQPVAPARPLTEDFSTVTERSAARATTEQRSMLRTRYELAAELSAGKDVLEVACGTGIGLRYLVTKTRRAVGGDYTESLLRQAGDVDGTGPCRVRLDAQVLPFRDRSFDVVVLCEALYYVPNAAAFAAEARRVLRNDGVLFICSVNCEWDGFIPSPFSTRYFAAQDIVRLLEGARFEVRLLGAFPVRPHSSQSTVVALLRRVAARLHLVPKTMRGKEWLKRAFYGPLEPLPTAVGSDLGPPAPLVPLDGRTVVTDFKVLYAIGRLT